MPKLRNLINNTPSRAVRVTIAGIRNSRAREDFILDNSTNGHSEGQMCYGDASIVTIEQITGVRKRAAKKHEKP